MSRGPVSEKALSSALLHAALRGTVYFLNPGRESPADFQIVNRQGVTFISVKRARCLHCSLAEMETEYCEAIFRLRAIPISPSVYREFWVCSRYGRWRFFEVRDKDMIELAIPVGGG
jgi:hypothetical protein